MKSLDKRFLLRYTSRCLVFTQFPVITTALHFIAQSTLPMVL